MPDDNLSDILKVVAERLKDVPTCRFGRHCDGAMQAYMVGWADGMKASKGIEEAITQYHAR